MAEQSRDDEFNDTFERACALDASLGERLKVVADAARKWSAAYGAAVDAFAARLNAAGVCDQAPTVGEHLPPFMLPDETGKLVGLEELVAAGPVAIAFHRGSWCPFCRMNTIALSRAHAQAVAAGGQIVAITPDRRNFSLALKSQLKVPFPILSDMDNGYAMSLNLAICIGEVLFGIHAESRPDDPRFAGLEGSMLPIPATFIVGRDGVVKARFVDPDYRRRMEIDDLLAALKGAA